MELATRNVNPADLLRANAEVRKTTGFKDLYDMLATMQTGYVPTFRRESKVGKLLEALGHKVFWIK